MGCTAPAPRPKKVPAAPVHKASAPFPPGMAYAIIGQSIHKDTLCGTPPDSDGGQKREGGGKRGSDRAWQYPPARTTRLPPAQGAQSTIQHKGWDTMWNFRLLLTLLCALCLCGASPVEAAEKKAGTRDLVFEEEDTAFKPLTADQLDEMGPKADALFAEQKYPEARDMYRTYLKSAVTIVPADHEVLLGVYLNLGICEYYLKDFKAAEPNLRRGIPRLVTVGKGKTPDPMALLATTFWAEILMQENRYKDAVLAVLDALPIMQKDFGPAHPLTSQLSGQLVDGLWALGKREDAIRVQQDMVTALAFTKPEKRGLYYYTNVQKLAELCNKDFQNVRAARLVRPTLVALEKSNTIEDPEDKISLLLNLRTILATSQYRLGRFAQAAALYEALLPEQIAASSAQDPVTLGTLSNLAVCLSMTGNLDKAQALMEKTLTEAQTALGPDHSVTLDIRANLANILQERGQLAKALTIREDVLARWEKTQGSEHESTLSAKGNLVALYSNLGDYDTALKLAEELLPLSQKILGKDHPQVLNTLTNIAVIYSNREKDDFAKARQLMQEVVVGKEKRLGKGHAETLRARVNVARTDVNMKKYKEAQTAFTALLPQFTKVLGADSLDTLELRHNMAVLQLEQNDAKGARAAMQALLPAVRAAGSDTLELFLLDDLRRACQTGKDMAAAEFFGRQAVKKAQEARASLATAPYSVQQAYAKDRTRVYQGLADALVAQGRVAEAQGVMSLLKKEELQDMIPAASTEIPTDMLAGLDPAIALRYQEVSGKLTALGKEHKDLLEREEAGDTLSAKEKTRLAQLSRDIGAAQKAFAAFMGTLSAELNKKKPGTAPGLDQLKQYQDLLGKLGDGVVLVQTILTDKKLWLILTTPTSQVARQSAVDMGQLSAKILRFRDILQDERQNAQAIAKEFYDALLAPLAADLDQAGAKMLMFSLDGPLRYIPMAALHNGKEWIIQKYMVSMFNDAALAAMSEAPSGVSRVAGLGVTKEHKYGRGKFSALPAVKDELATIVKSDSTPKGLVPGYMTLDEGFTDKELLRVLGEKYPMVHMASHFHFNAKNPQESFLLLGDGSGLNLQRIMNENFDFKAVDLLALSACQTARGGVDANGKEVEGFGALAQKRGAKAVLATLWPVFDESTGLLMARFYALRGDKLSSAASLQKSQLEMIDRKVPGKDFSHPFYWAPFVLMGDWR